MTTTSAHNIHSHGTIHSIRPVTDTNQNHEDQEVEADETTPVIGSGGQGPICHWDELPAWMQDNPAIFTGYRRPTFSYKKCAASLGFLHNESGKLLQNKSRIGSNHTSIVHVIVIRISTLDSKTNHPIRSPTIVNVWSHLIGAIACIIVAPLAYFKIFHILETVHWTDVMHFYIFMAGAILCLSMSALFHLFSCHSEPVSHQWNRCDYVGIVFLITGSFYPAIFYGNIFLPFLVLVRYPAMKDVSLTLNLSYP